MGVYLELGEAMFQMVPNSNSHSVFRHSFAHPRPYDRRHSKSPRGIVNGVVVYGRLPPLELFCV